jgi:hypothetical protein
LDNNAACLGLAFLGTDQNDLIEFDERFCQVARRVHKLHAEAASTVSTRRTLFTASPKRQACHEYCDY